jgi:tRNA threonylcarbamoyladenosine biosynthesis protein TsaB
MASLILAFETATDVCSVALLERGVVLAQQTAEQPRMHAERLAPMTQEVLKAAARSVHDVSAVAVSAGPGSYTGLRIGTSTAKGLAFATGACLIGVPSLPALALAAGGAKPEKLRAFVARKARQNEVYAAICDVGDDVDVVLEARLLTTADALEVLHRTASSTGLPIIACGSAAGPLVESYGAAHGAREIGLSSARPDAQTVGRLAARMFEDGRTADIDTFEPYYLKEYVAAHPRADIFSRLPF